MTAFIITRDVLTEEDGPTAYATAVGVIGPRGASRRDVERLKAGEGIEFRLLDDDREVYYEGRRLEESDADEVYGGDPELAPLDCFGMPDSGCTIQEEKDEEGQWRAIN